MDRRDFNKLAVAASSAALTSTAAGQGFGPALEEGKKPLQVGMLIFDEMTNLDYVGPHDIFARVPGAKVHTLAKTLDPITTDANDRILPQNTFSESPPLDILFIGGGFGTTALMEDAETLEFLKRQGANAKFVTSVCTGALVLGAAGLLKGYKATTHWAALEVLPLLGAEPVHERVVLDRNRFTGGGVTAGIDFGIAVVARIWGEELAQTIQLAMEYAPQPPYPKGGDPRTAKPAIVERARQLLAHSTKARTEAARRVASRWS